MDYRFESEIWSAVQSSLIRDVFIAMLAEAFSTYRRQPGYFPLDGLHASDVEEDGLKALSIALSRSGNPTGIAIGGYLAPRAILRSHLYTVLQRYVLTHSRASDAIVDNSMASDLGL